MLATLLLCCVVRASCHYTHGVARSSERHGGVECSHSGGRPETSAGRERKLSVLLHSDSDNRDIVALDDCVYFFQVGAELTLTCTTGNKDRKIFWADAPPDGWQTEAAPSSAELRLKLSLGAGDKGARLTCSDKPPGNYDLRQHEHIDISLIPRSQSVEEWSPSLHPVPLYLRRREPWTMQNCHSGWIKEPKKKHPVTRRVYKLGDIIFKEFSKKDSGTILYCNTYSCIDNPDSHVYDLSMIKVVECTRTQRLYEFLLKEDSRIRFPKESNESFTNIQLTDDENRFNDRTQNDGSRGLFQNNRGGAGSIHYSATAEGSKVRVWTYLPNDGASGGATQQVAADGTQIQNNRAGDRKHGPDVGVVVGAVLGVVVVALLVALVLVLRHVVATRRDNTPSEPYVVYTELAEPQGGGMPPPPPPRNLPPYACVVGTLVPATPKLAPRPISHAYCTVK